MMFVLREEDWVLDSLEQEEWFFVQQLPGLASGEGFSDEVKRVLFPSPIVDGDGLPVESDESKDWAEFVQPDIEDGFARDRAVVALDIDGAERIDGAPSWNDEDEDAPTLTGPLWRVVVDADHTEQWYSTLNQARLLMNRAHNLADDEARFFRLLLGASDEEGTGERRLLLAQYEFYCVIQNILIENLMR